MGHLQRHAGWEGFQRQHNRAWEESWTWKDSRSVQITVISYSEPFTQIPGLPVWKKNIFLVTARPQETRLLLPRREASAWHF